MYAEIGFKTGEEFIPIVVDLVDNPGVKIWAKKCSEIDEQRQIIPQPVPGGKPMDRDEWDRLYQEVKLVHDNLIQSRTPMPLWVENPEEITQHHLNVWHRWFTDNTAIIDQDNSSWDLTKEHFWLHELNQIVHAIEQYFNEWPKDQFDGRFAKEINLFVIVDALGRPVAGSADIYEYRQYHTFDHCDLILDQAVHGKTLMQSFIDNDDPNHWDTSGHHVTHGGAKLVINSNRSKIYQSPAFLEWANRNRLDTSKVFADYPLGQIRDRDQSVLDHLWYLAEHANMSATIEIHGN